MPETCPAIVSDPHSFATHRCGRPVKRDGFCGVHAPSLATTAPAGPNFGLTPTSARHTIYRSFEGTDGLAPASSRHTMRCIFGVADGPVLTAYGATVFRVTTVSVDWQFTDAGWTVDAVEANGFKLNKKGAQTDHPTSRVWFDRPGDDVADAQHLYGHAVDASRDLLPAIG